MSHFCVAVFTAEEPTEAVLEKVLQPFHEYECTGVEDEFVVDVDCTDEVLDTWNETVKAVRLVNGTVLSRYDESLYRKTGSGKDTFFLPEGATEIEVKRSEIEKQTLEEWAEDYGNWKKKADGRFYRYTNPNAKWDWWQVGGRFTGLMSVYDPENDSSNQEVCELCGGTGMRYDDLGRKARAEDPSYTCNGCGGKGVKTKWPTQWAPFKGDKMRIRNIPLKEIRERTEKLAAEEWDKVHAVTGDKTWKTWQEVLAEHEDNVEEARNVYHSQEAVTVIREARELGFIWDVDRFVIPRDEYIKAAGDGAIVPFAYVLDGKWYERGKMGWWACVSNEKDKDQWKNDFMEVLKNLPGDHWVTVVDCHI